MGNLAIMSCPASGTPQLSSLALDICPVPSYVPNSLINDMLVSPNSSLHLSDHFRDVQNSLSPSELSDFTRRLRTTFGREGKVTMGGVGVVALALAVLFDTLAKEVKGQWVPPSGPIPGLFLQEPGRTQLPPVLVVSEYLRLVPHIANNPDRMREETENCFHKLKDIKETYIKTMEREGLSYVEAFNSISVWKLVFGLQHHHRRLSNSTSSVDLSWLSPMVFFFDDDDDDLPSPEAKSSFNCDLNAGNRAFKEELLKSKEMREELKQCGTPLGENPLEDDIPDIELVFFAQSVFNMKYLEAWAKGNLVAPEEDFDLKAKSHLPF